MKRKRSLFAVHAYAVAVQKENDNDDSLNSHTAAYISDKLQLLKFSKFGKL